MKKYFLFWGLLLGIVFNTQSQDNKSFNKLKAVEISAVPEVPGLDGNDTLNFINTSASVITVNDTTLEGYILQHSFRPLAPIKWELQDTPSKNIKGIATGLDMIVGVGSSGTGDRAIYSYDGVNYSSGVTPADNQWNSVACGITEAGVEMCVSVSSSGTGDRAMYTTDGINWSIGVSAADNGWSKVKYGNGQWTAVSVTGSLNRVMTTEDGINWTSQTTPNNNILQDIEYYEELDLWVTAASSGTNNRIATSDDDAVTWTARTTPEDNNFKTITCGKGICFALSTDGTNQLMTSEDGAVTWTARSCPAGTWEESWYDNRGIFFAVASDESDSSAMYSYDAKNWQLLHTPDTLTLIEIIDADGLIVALNFKNQGNSMLTSGVFHPESNVFDEGLTSKSLTVGIADSKSTITTDGKLGLGTTSPASTIDAIRTDAATSGTSEIFKFTQSNTGSVAAYVIGRWITGSGGNLALRVNNLNNANPSWQFNAGASEAMKFAQNNVDKFEIDASGNIIMVGATAATVTSSDLVIWKDVTDGNKLRTATAQSIADFGGAANIISDTSPQLGGELDVNDFNIVSNTVAGGLNIFSKGSISLNFDSDGIDEPGDIFRVRKNAANILSYQASDDVWDFEATFITNASRITADNVRLDGQTLSSVSGDLYLDAANGDMKFRDGGVTFTEAITGTWDYKDNDLISVGTINIGTSESTTISSGSITVTKSHVNVATEGGAGTDDLNFISGSNEGDILILRPNSGANDVVLKHAATVDGSNNLKLSGGIDYTMDGINTRVMLFFSGGAWQMISASDNN
jgi:hypothetical protein